jgi:hypothetical protein
MKSRSFFPWVSVGVTNRFASLHEILRESDLCYFDVSFCFYF